ncbi:MAG: hypothetical protein ACODAA_06750 [Gemmatimonadota bacterium]
MKRTGSILTFCLLVLATPCLSQGIEEGERVRLRVDSPVRYGGYTTIRGHFVDIRKDAIRLTVEGEEYPRTIELSEIELIQHRVGERSNELLGAIVGGPVGIGGALALSGGLDSLDDVWILPAGFAVGVAAGYVIGSNIHSEVWRTVDLEVTGTGIGFAVPAPWK